MVRAWHRDRTKNELRAWPGCREPAQRPAHGATRPHHLIVFVLADFGFESKESAGPTNNL